MNWLHIVDTIVICVRNHIHQLHRYESIKNPTFKIKDSIVAFVWKRLTWKAIGKSICCSIKRWKKCMSAKYVQPDLHARAIYEHTVAHTAMIGRVSNAIAVKKIFDINQIWTHILRHMHIKSWCANCAIRASQRWIACRSTSGSTRTKRDSAAFALKPFHRDTKWIITFDWNTKISPHGNVHFARNPFQPSPNIGHTFMNITMRQNRIRAKNATDRFKPNTIWICMKPNMEMARTSNVTIVAINFCIKVIYIRI